MSRNHEKCMSSQIIHRGFSKAEMLDIVTHYSNRARLAQVSLQWLPVDTSYGKYYLNVFSSLFLPDYWKDIDEYFIISER